MPFFSRVFRSRDQGAASKAKKGAVNNPNGITQTPRMHLEDAYTRVEVAPVEVEELVHICTQEIKSRAINIPFLLLPFRPTSDPGAARPFIRNFFKSRLEGSYQYRGERLQLELRLVEPMVLCSIIKWCWSRLPGGVVTWEIYKLFYDGEKTSYMSRDAFATLIPLSVESDSRRALIIDFFDLLAAIAARGKSNGLGGRKLSRMAGWWAFAHSDQGKGFEGGYRSWERAADATSHLFFAYLRSLAPASVEGVNGISALPRSLQVLVSQTEYPPEKPSALQAPTPRVLMIVNTVSPTPFALLRRARNFEYRNDDWLLREFSRFEDPVDALTDECQRVMRCISTTNQSGALSLYDGAAVQNSDTSWSRFEDLGFSGLSDSASYGSVDGPSLNWQSPRLVPQPGTYDFGRPTTPSWADFLSAGFADESGKTGPLPLLLPHDKVLPPIGPVRVQSSQSHLRGAAADHDLEPGELASIAHIGLEDTFWWVWMTSLAAEEPAERKAVFGRCALIETTIAGGNWLVIEEQVKGAATAPADGAYIAEKKSRFGFSKRGRLTMSRRVSNSVKQMNLHEGSYSTNNVSILRMNNAKLSSEQRAKIHAAAAAIAQRQRPPQPEPLGERRGRLIEEDDSKANSVFTLQAAILTEAVSALKWASNGDTDNLRYAYMNSTEAGKGRSLELLRHNGHAVGEESASDAQTQETLVDRELPALPKAEPSSQEKASALTPKTMPDLPSPAYTSSNPTHRSSESSRPAVDVALDQAPVTLPAVSNPKAIERKPVRRDSDTRDSELERHPAFRSRVSAEAASARVNGIAFKAPTSNPEGATVPDPVKAKKPSTTGFKWLFGRTRADPTSRSATSEHNTSVATLPPNATPTLDRRVSGRLKKDPPPAIRVRTSATSEEGQNEAESFHHEPGPTLDEAAMDRSIRVEPAQISPVHTIDGQDAAYAFDRFAQGPLEDVPAFVPAESPEREPSPPRRFQTQAAARLYPMTEVEEPASPATPKAAEMESNRAEMETGATGDDVSEQSVDLHGHAYPTQDRWAQIRRNAAERAARVSESEQSNLSVSQSVKTDDGETSGEETIEARVARIKARVAELTGAKATVVY